MALSRRFRRWLSGALVLTILFTQLAVSAYVCPTDRARDAPHAHAAMAGMPDCHESTDECRPTRPRAASCARRIAPMRRNRPPAPRSPDLQPNPASVALLQRVIEPVTRCCCRSRWCARAPLTGPPDPLPLYLSLLVLRN